MIIIKMQAVQGRWTSGQADGRPDRQAETFAVFGVNKCVWVCVGLLNNFLVFGAAGASNYHLLSTSNTGGDG